LPSGLDANLYLVLLAEFSLLYFSSYVMMWEIRNV
jgi:hypothetical protein